MIILAGLTFLIIVAIAGLHLAWAMGSVFPARDEGELARTVTGFHLQDRMPPPSASLAVAVALFMAALAALALGMGAYGPGRDALNVGGALLSLLFFLRGVAGYTAYWRHLTPEEPFATYDRRYYSPLSIFLGLCFLILTISHSTLGS